MDVFTLPSVIDTASVGPLRAQLAERRGAALELDASQIQRIGGLGLQVLLSAIRTWDADGLPLTIGQPTAAFSEMLRATGAASLAEFNP